MSDFLENEAEVSSGEDEDDHSKDHKRKNKSSRPHIPSDSSEEEEDGEIPVFFYIIDNVLNRLTRILHNEYFLYILISINND